MASAAETELGSLFHNCQDALPLRQALIEMGHPQPPTPIATDNSTALGIVTASIRQRRSKSTDMRFHWVRDRINQNQFLVFWAPGATNLADYFSKHHAPYHHKKMRKHYLLNLAVKFPNRTTAHLMCKGVYLRILSTLMSGTRQTQNPNTYTKIPVTTSGTYNKMKISVQPTYAS